MRRQMGRFVGAPIVKARGGVLVDWHRRDPVSGPTDGRLQNRPDTP